MTLEEAIEELEVTLSGLLQMDEYYVAIQMAIEALKKQIPKTPVQIGEGYRYTDVYRCPSCGGNFSGTGIADYCYHCGQKLNWPE